MGIDWEINLDGMFEEAKRQAMAEMNESLAKQLAERARDNGLDSTDAIELDIQLDDDTPDFQPDEQLIRRRANEILAADA